MILKKYVYFCILGQNAEMDVLDYKIESFFFQNQCCFFINIKLWEYRKETKISQKMMKEDAQNYYFQRNRLVNIGVNQIKMYGSHYFTTKSIQALSC